MRQLKHSLVMAGIIISGCGGDSGADPMTSNEQADSGVESTPDGSSPAAQADASFAGGTSDLFDATPQCPAGAVSLLKLQGDLDGHPLDVTLMAFSSQLDSASLTTFTSAGEDVSVPFALTHAGAGFQPGQIHMLLGGRLDLPNSDTGNSGPYCVRGGETGSVPAESQPAAGASIQFHISKVQKLARTESNPDGTCEGPEIDVNLLGCVWRTSDYLP